MDLEEFELINNSSAELTAAMERNDSSGVDLESDGALLKTGPDSSWMDEN